MFLQVSVILFTRGGWCLVPGGVWSQHACRFPGPHPRGKYRGIWPRGGVSRPTPKGEVEGGSGPGPHPRGKLRGIWSRHPPVMATAAGGAHPTGMHSFFLKKFAGSLIPCLKARVGSFNCSWQRHICYMFPVIPFWCDTCWPLGSQHGNQAVIFHIPRSRHCGAQNWDLLYHHCLTMWDAWHNYSKFTMVVTIFANRRTQRLSSRDQRPQRTVNTVMDTIFFLQKALYCHNLVVSIWKEASYFLQHVQQQQQTVLVPTGPKSA